MILFQFIPTISVWKGYDISPILHGKGILAFGGGAVLGGLGDSRLVRMIIVRRAPRRPQQGIFVAYVFARQVASMPASVSFPWDIYWAFIPFF
jgi:hypothetical protein